MHDQQKLNNWKFYVFLPVQQSELDGAGTANTYINVVTLFNVLNHLQGCYLQRKGKNLWSEGACFQESKTIVMALQVGSVAG